MVHAGRLSDPGPIGIWRSWFVWRVFLQRVWRKKTSEQVENQQQTPSTYGTGSESSPGHIGGRRALSILRHPCPLPTLLLKTSTMGCIEKVSYILDVSGLIWAPAQYVVTYSAICSLFTDFLSSLGVNESASKV